MATETLNTSELSPTLHARVGGDFGLLSAAASKAQEAASRYESHTTSLLHARRLSSGSNSAENRVVSATAHLPLTASAITSCKAESFQPLHQRKLSDPEISASSSSSQDCVVQPQADDLNSAGTGTTPRNNQLTSNAAACTFRPHKNKTLLSLGRSNSRSPASEDSPPVPGHAPRVTKEEGQVRRSLSDSSTPPTRDSSISKPCLVIPTCVKKWINEGAPAAPDSNLLSHLKPTNEPTGTQDMPKPQSSQSQPCEAPKAIRGAPDAPGQMAKILPLQPSKANVEKTDIQAQRDCGIQDSNPSATARLDGQLSSLVNDIAFVQVFKDTIYPCIIASAKAYRGRLSEEILVSIGKSVANQVVTESFRKLARECSYNLDDAQKMKIRKLIQSFFHEKALRAVANIKSSNESDDTKKKHRESNKSNDSAGRSRINPTGFQIQTLVLPGLSSSRSPSSLNSSVDRDDHFFAAHVKHSADECEKALAKTSTVHQSPKSILETASTSSPPINGKLQSAPLSSRKEFHEASKQMTSTETQTSPAIDQRALGAAEVSVKEDFKLSSVATRSGSALIATVNSDLEVKSPSRGSLVNSIELEPPTEQSNGSREMKEKTKDRKNHRENESPASNAMQQHFIELDVRSKLDGNSEAPVSFEATSDEDGDEILASWLQGKPSKENSDDDRIPSKKNVSSLPSKEDIKFQLSSDESPDSRKNSPPAKSLHADNHVLPPEGENQLVSASLTHEISDTDDPLTTLPGPSQREHAFRPSYSTSPARSLSLLPSISVIESTASDRAAIMERYKYSVRKPNQVPSQGSKSSSHSQEHLNHRQEESTQHESLEELPQHQEGLSRRRNMPPQGQVETSQHQQLPTQSPPRRSHRLKRKGDPQVIKALAELASHHNSVRRPYRPHRVDRGEKVPSVADDNSTKHVDVSEEECGELLRAWLSFDSPDGSHPTSHLGRQFRNELQEILQNLSRAKLSEFIHHLHAISDQILPGRSSRGIRAFILDLVEGVAPTSYPKVVRGELQVIDPCHHPLRSTASLLRNRELGISTGGWFRNPITELQVRTSEKISPWRSWKGASGDVVACAWAPGSTTFAVGAAAPANEEDLQYNRPRNLLLGDLLSNTLKELPDHRVDRPKPETISRGPNSTQAVYDACDPKVYMTVSALQFSSDGSCMYTASHDKTVKVWDVSTSNTLCLQTLQHAGLVSDLDVSGYFRNVFAAATKTVDESIHIYFPESDDQSNPRLCSVQFSSPRATSKRNVTMYPECLRWGRTQNTSRLLLAGFQQWGSGEHNRGTEGEICLWNVHAGESLKVTPSSQSIYAATWHPTLDLFAIGGSRPSRSHPLTHPHSTRSVVRTWDLRSLSRYAAEYECPAIDMQDVTFNAMCPNIVTAGCTDSATYVWDFRKPDNYLHKLQHGRPLLDWDHTRPQEEGDPGVMMTVWGRESTLLYTGSSDGIVKCWDVMRAPEDVHIRDVGDLGAGVQSGAFSPDFSHLLVGDSDGGVHILSSAPVDTRGLGGLDDGCTQSITFVQAQDARQTIEEADNPGSEGIRAAQKLVASGRVVLDSRYGVSQGPRYRGPYAKHARVDEHDPFSRLLPEFEALQPFSNRGEQNVSVTQTRRDLLDERRRLIAEAGAVEKKDDHLSKVKIEEAGQTGKPQKRRLDPDDFSPSVRKKSKRAIIDLTTPSPSDEDERLFFNSSHSSRQDEEAASEISEEDHWWPRMDEEVFKKLNIRS